MKFWFATFALSREVTQGFCPSKLGKVAIRDKEIALLCERKKQNVFEANERIRNTTLIFLNKLWYFHNYSQVYFTVEE